jgi:thiamine biosynthesis lipoprotein
MSRGGVGRALVAAMIVFGCVAALVVALASGDAVAAAPVRSVDLPTIAGPAMGTTWRVTLGGPVAAMTTGEVHREIDGVLRRIDRAASTWREDSDVSRFNRAAAGEWIEVAPDLAAIIDVARHVHERSNGGFDITVAPLVRLWRSERPPPDDAVAAALGRVGMQLVEARSARDGHPAAIRKTVAGVELDLDGIAPGYAVDRVGELLVSLGSRGHLVELGGEVRAWGVRSADTPWRVAVQSTATSHADTRSVCLAAGQALATSTIRTSGGVIDPRTGRIVKRSTRSATVLAESCAEADAWAVASLVLGLEPDDDGLVAAPSRR